MRVVIWMNIPSHHQVAFFHALRQAGVDLFVRYYDKAHLEERRSQGWRQNDLPEGEVFVDPNLSALNTIPDYKERIHIVPGYGSPFLRQLATFFSRESVEWVHWSECFLPYTMNPGDRNAMPAQKCLDFLAGRNAFLYLGSLYHRKATDVLLKAFASISEQEKSKWALLLVGKDMSQGKYKEMARRCVEKNTIMLLTSTGRQMPPDDGGNDGGSIYIVSFGFGMGIWQRSWTPAPIKADIGENGRRRIRATRRGTVL